MGWFVRIAATHSNAVSVYGNEQLYMPHNDFHYSELPAWQKKVIEGYPRIYGSANRTGHNPDQSQDSLAEDHCTLRSGFECGPGWQALIEQLSSTADALVAQLKDSGLQDDASITPVIIKQKLGELRWQGQYNLLSPFDTLWVAYISQIRRESVQTCEMSGETGRIRSLEGFVICLSDKEYLKWKKSPHQMQARYWQLEDVP